MAAKRFQPILNEIPEEETFSSNGNSIEMYQGMGSQRSGSVISLKRENSRKKNCVGCPGCMTNNQNDLLHSAKYMASCTNCVGAKGDKQNSIRKWLENIPLTKQTTYNEVHPSLGNMANSLLSLPISDHRHRIKKQNSFTATGSIYNNMSEDYLKPNKSSSMSVRSEPLLRSLNYNLPLPEFDTSMYQNNSFNNSCYGQTISQIDDIRPIGFKDYQPSSLRINQRRVKNDLPDMVNEAIALDHSAKSFNQSSSDEERFTSCNSKGLIPFIRNNSESPVTNDYETDSLERNTNKKSVPPTDYSDIPSSQASPSLSTALPLEEELTMRNAVYKTHSSSSNTPSPYRELSVDLNNYESIEEITSKKINNKSTTKAPNDYSLVSEVYVNNSFGSAPSSPNGSDSSMCSRKLIVSKNNLEEKPGCLLIEVKDSPENYIKIHESDDFEPDTLDRKHPKNKHVTENNDCSINPFLEEINGSRSSQRIQLRSSGTFKKSVDKVESSPKFQSLRNEYENRATFDRPIITTAVYSGSKSLDENIDEWEETVEWTNEEGRILTLELRHSKRQRQITPPTIKQVKNLARPDVLPPLLPSDDDHIYEQPSYPPRKVVDPEQNILLETPLKNGSGRSLSPRSYIQNSIIEPVTSDSSYMGAESTYDPSFSPLRASVQSQSSEYENVDQISADCSRHSSRRRSDRNHNGGCINTDTFVKSNKTESKRFRRKKCNIQDSGYLSSDSTSSRQVQRKLVIAKIMTCSESDDTENEARSESGAESVETHSVYFDNFRKPQVSLENDDFRFGNNKLTDSSRKLKRCSN